ncbi:hypothetical protein JTE90_007285 [Oedothorax gibbosus]|uniref:Uncharacterized protein n=1 Tax=Oedothorax gibbosus TaxID=931172 RepID=A0AAV6VLN1_9ARAC|nr:hypothetical protein JTE90_007285 [Oedothorax gibbosus]
MEAMMMVMGMEALVPGVRAMAMAMEVIMVTEEAGVTVMVLVMGVDLFEEVGAIPKEVKVLMEVAAAIQVVEVEDMAATVVNFLFVACLGECFKLSQPLRSV